VRVTQKRMELRNTRSLGEGDAEKNGAQKYKELG